MQEKQICYIEFRITDAVRFQTLLRFFNALKSWSQQRDSGTYSVEDTQETRAVSAAEETIAKRSFDKLENWMLIMRPQDLQLLGMPGHAISINTLRAWRGLSKRERRALIGKDESLMVLADFADMLKQFDNAEYELTHLGAISSDRARLEYAIAHYPYEGKHALESLLLFFGFFSILDSNG